MIDLLQKEQKRTFGVSPRPFYRFFSSPPVLHEKNITIIDFLLDFTALSMYFI